jgi:hypothetical protein
MGTVTIHCRGITGSISASTMARWVTADAINPWRHRS